MKKLLAYLLITMLVLGTTGLALAEDPLGKFDPPVKATYARNAGLDMKFLEGQSYTENIWMTEYLEDLGIELETVWTAEGVESYNSRLQLSILDQDIPDIFVCNPSQFELLVEADMLEDLTDVLAAYQSDLVKENLMADGGLGLSQATVQGRVYGLPQASVGDGKMMYVFLRDDWRIKLGLPEPKTMEDILAMAKAFTFDDPDGNGAADTYGLGISNKPYETYFALAGFFNGYGGFMDQWIEKDGALEFGLIQPEIKTALGVLHQAFEDGLISPEFIVTDSYQVSQDAIAGRTGINFGEWWCLGWPLVDGVRIDQSWRAYPILYAEGVTEQKIGTKAKLENRYVVRKGYEHPEALVKMYNLFQERVMSMKYDTFKYKLDETGVYSIEGLAPIAPVIGHDRNMRNHIVVTEAIDTGNTAGLENIDQENLYGKATKFIASEWANMDEYADFYVAYWGNIGPDSIYGILKQYGDNGMFKRDVYYGSDTEAMTNYAAQLRSNAEEMILSIISGEAPLDSFDDFVASWKALGGDEMTQEVNEWYAQL